MSVAVSGRAQRPLRLVITALILNILFLLYHWGSHHWWGAATSQQLTPMALLAVGIRGMIVLLFITFAWREIWLLFTRPNKQLGTGLSRVWAVARTTIFEAWAGRIWLLPLIWLVCTLILIMAIVPFDESERIPLYIRTLLSSQQILVLVMMWVMACVSLPREREKKTLISTSSKPLSRLEILLGKFTGFAVATGAMLAFMGAASLVILYISDFNLRARAGEAYEIQRRDFDQTRQTPSQALQVLSEEGSLHAYNYITVPPEGMSILGGFRLVDGKPVRQILGGTSEKIFYRFTPFLPAEPGAIAAGPGLRPYFEFYFPIDPRSSKAQPIRLNISAYSSQQYRIAPPKPQEKTIELNESGVGRWEPSVPEDLFTPVDPSTLMPIVDPRTGEQINMGEVTIEVTCTTPDVFLQVLEGAVPDASNAIPAGAEFNVTLHVDRRAPNVQFVPGANPIIRGFERRDRQEISGPKPPARAVEYALYHFPGHVLNNVPVDAEGNFQITLQLETYKGGNAGEPTRMNVDLMSSDPLAGNPLQIADQEVVEKRPTKLSIPKRFLGDPNPATRGDLYVRIYSITPEHSISVLENSVRIELPTTFFFINLLKSELIIYIEALLLIAVAITCSVRLGWPVAMFLTGIVVAFGVLVNFIASLPEYGGLGAINYRPGVDGQGKLFNFFDSAASGLWHVLGFISTLVPNFTIFDPQLYIGSLQNIPWSVVIGNGLFGLTYALPFLALSYLLFRKQELG